MKYIDDCKCIRCNHKLLTIQSVIEDDVMYQVMCMWCGWKSKDYSTKQEALEHYENEIF